MYLAISLFILLIICFCVGYFILSIFGFFLKKPNPYISYHKKRILNDKNYEEYLKWLDKENGSLPVSKLLTREEIIFKQKMKLNN